MGEVNLDRIDRAILQEYQLCHDGYRLKETVRTIEDLRLEEKAPACALWFRCSPVNKHDNDCALAR